jgi:hypothetical protein
MLAPAPDIKTASRERRLGIASALKMPPYELLSSLGKNIFSEASLANSGLYLTGQS